MSNYRLVDSGYATFKKIMHGRKWVGRVAKVPAGYLGIIGKTEFTSTSEATAFHEVVSRHLGYSSASALDSRNRQVRAAKREARAQATYAMNEAYHNHNFDPLFDILKGTKVL